MKNGKTTSRSELYEVQSNADSESPKISTGKNYSSITCVHSIPYARNAHLVNFTWFTKQCNMQYRNNTNMFKFMTVDHRYMPGTRFLSNNQDH